LVVCRGTWQLVAHYAWRAMIQVFHHVLGSLCFRRMEWVCQALWKKGLFIGLGVLGMRSRNNLPMEKLHNYPAIECPYLGLIGKPD